MGPIIVTISIAVVFGVLSTVGLIATVRGRQAARPHATPPARAESERPVHVVVSYGSPTQESTATATSSLLWRSDKASAS